VNTKLAFGVFTTGPVLGWITIGVPHYRYSLDQYGPEYLLLNYICDVPVPFQVSIPVWEHSINNLFMT